MAIRKVLLIHKENDTVYDIFPKTTAEVVSYGETTVSAELTKFANDISNRYTINESNTKIKEACDNLYNKIIGLTDSDTTIDQAYDTLKEVAVWINEHGEVAAAFTTDIAKLKQTIGDNSSGIIKDISDTNIAISNNADDILSIKEDLNTIFSSIEQIEDKLKSKTIYMVDSNGKIIQDKSGTGLVKIF